MATHSSVLAWRIPGTVEHGGLPSMGSHRVGHDSGDLAAATANYGGGNEDNDDLLQKIPCIYCYAHYPNPAAGHHRPTTPLETPRHSQTLPGKSGSVSCGVTAPFSWVLVHTSFCCVLQESISQSCVSSGNSKVGLMATSSKRAYAILKSAAPRAPVTVAVHC